MSGETDLATLLQTMRPELDGREFGYACLPPGTPLPPDLDPAALIAEAEGLTVVAPVDRLAAAGISHLPGWARITLQVHSSLAAVGLTAVIATALARRGISANVVAGYHHDHLYLPAKDATAALAILRACATDGTAAILTVP